MLLKKYPQQTIYLQYKIFISYISENTITYETKCMNFSYIVTIKVIKKIIFVFVTAINSAVFKSYYTKHHLFFEILSNVHNFVAMELAP